MSDTETLLNAIRAASAAGAHDLVNDLLGRFEATAFAQLWCGGNQLPWPMDADKQQAIVERIQQSEKTPGDLLVHAVRALHDLQRFDWLPPKWIFDAGGVGSNPFHLDRLHVYDCLQNDGTVEVPRATRLFGNANVGYRHLTNLSIAGQLIHNGRAALVTSWFATTWPLTTQIPLDGTVEFIREDTNKIVQVQRLDVLHGRPQMLFVGLPPRSYVSVRVDLRNPEALEPNHRLYIHFQGWQWPAR